MSEGGKKKSFDLDIWLLVIKQCALERDLSLWEAGDETEVGERGVTLRYVRYTLY